MIIVDTLAHQEALIQGGEKDWRKYYAHEKREASEYSMISYPSFYSNVLRDVIVNNFFMKYFRSQQ